MERQDVWVTALVAGFAIALGFGIGRGAIDWPAAALFVIVVAAVTAMSRPLLVPVPVLADSIDSLTATPDDDPPGYL